MDEPMITENFISEESCNKENDWEDCPFLGIPEEMFLHICSFLEVRDVVHSLSYVCKKFYEILQSESVFKSWIASRWGRPYPMYENEDYINEINWKEACFLLEKEWKLWSGSFKHSVIENVHLSNADAVLLLNGATHCVTGSRDHFMVLWDIRDEVREPNILEKKEAHQGWVWRVREVGDSLLSASWDYSIKEWSWKEGILEKNSMRCDGSVLCLTADNNGLIYGGTFSRHIHAFDTRVQSHPLFSFNAHRCAVLTLDTVGNDIVSGSEDKTLAVWDTRTRKLRQRLIFDKQYYPITCEVMNNILHVGGEAGIVRTFTMQDGAFKAENSFALGHDERIVTIKMTRGAIVTGSRDGVVRSHLTLRPPSYIGSVQTTGSAASGVDYCKGKLVIGTASTVEFWAPASS